MKTFLKTTYRSKSALDLLNVMQRVIDALMFLNKCNDDPKRTKSIVSSESCPSDIFVSRAARIFDCSCSEYDFKYGSKHWEMQPLNS